MTADTPSARAWRAKELAERATEGPWFHRQAGETDPAGLAPYDWIADAAEHGRHHKIIIPRDSCYGGSADYALIAESRTLLPALADDVLAGEARTEELRSLLLLERQNCTGQAAEIQRIRALAKEAETQFSAQHETDVQEIARCHARLEIDHMWRSKGGGPLERFEVPYAERLDVPDGIECRDETIKLMDQSRDSLIAERDCLTAQHAADQREIERLKGALIDIRGAHVPDQPASSQADEVSWVMQHVARLRGIAMRALDDRQ